MRATRHPGARRALWTSAGWAALLVVWVVVADRNNPLLVASPTDTLDALGEVTGDGTLLDALVTTLGRLLLGVGIGTAIGVVVGVAAGAAAPLRWFLRPTQVTLLGMPPIALVILALVWFGTGGSVPTVVVAALTVPVVYQATSDAVTGLDRALLEMAHTFAMPRGRIVRDIVLPGIAAQVITGVTIAAGTGVRITIMAELLAATTGIGAELALARTNLDTPMVFAWVVVAIALVAVVEGVVIRPLGRRVTRWADPDPDPAPGG